jgi:Right handed beta helix region/GH141 insertion domain
VSDETVRERLSAAARTHVLEVDLRALGIRHFAELKSRGFARPTTPAHNELFFDGRPMTLARWPNEGHWTTIAGFPADGGQNDEHGGKLGKLENGFYYTGDQPDKWKTSEDIWVHGYWAWDWANSYERVASLDLKQKLVKTAPPYGIYGFRKGQRFYFLNVLEELDQPGEWYLDRAAGKLYFWPTEGSAPPARAVASTAKVSVEAASPEALLSVLGGPLLKLSGVSNVTFRGLILEATRGNAVEIQGGATNLIADCVIRNIGDYGVKIESGFGHGVEGCDIFDTGDGGVSLEGGNRQTLAPGGHFVENCEFARQGRWSKCYVPAILMEGAGLRASHNLIHDHPHCAILFGGNDQLIEFNEIYHIALETGDVGAIYTGRDYTFRGNRIRYNYIHDTGGVGLGSMGVYMDDCVSGTEIYGNVFYQVQRATFLGGGRDHQVLNNIFVDCDYAVELDGRGLDGSPVWHEMVDQTMRQRLAEVPLALYRQRYPAMKGLDAYYGPPGGPVLEGAAFKGVPPEGNVVARNVCVGKWLHVYWHATPAILRLENNLTNAASSFVHLPSGRPKATDFVLRPDSPAWRLGFERIPLEQIGLRRAPEPPASPRP